MTMLEKVARAICSKSDEYCFWKDGLAQQDATCSGCLDQAKAAIEALWEPTEAMLKTEMDLGGHGFRDGECDQADPLKVWQAMISAALKETA